MKRAGVAAVLLIACASAPAPKPATRPASPSLARAPRPPDDGGGKHWITCFEDVRGSVTAAIASPASGEADEACPDSGATGRIVGRIHDASTGQPMILVVIASGPSGTGRRFMLSDRSGRFTVCDLPADMVSLLFVNEDAKFRAEAPVESRHTTSLDVRMSSEPVGRPRCR